MLPEGMAAEVTRFFDQHVKLQLAADRQRHPGDPVSGALENTDRQNTVVGRVFRQLVLPMLLDMQTIFLDMPYHEIQAACSRLAPHLHGARMGASLSVLREVVRMHMEDTDIDLLAPPPPRPSPAPAAPGTQGRAQHDPPSRSPILAVRGHAAACRRTLFNMYGLPVCALRIVRYASARKRAPERKQSRPHQRQLAGPAQRPAGLPRIRRQHRTPRHPHCRSHAAPARPGDRPHSV